MKLNVKRILQFLLILVVFSSVADSNSGSYSSEVSIPPVSVFSDLDGTWEGNFIGYDLKGNILYKIKVRQIYKTVNRTTQSVEIEDTLSNGEVIRGKGRNIADIKSDGSLELKCIVEKSNGDRVDHVGRLTEGPGGEKKLIWYSMDDNKQEMFVEGVEKSGEETFYTISGMGIYGNTAVLMEGRYKKVE